MIKSKNSLATGNGLKGAEICLITLNNLVMASFIPFASALSVKFDVLFFNFILEIDEKLCKIRDCFDVIHQFEPDKPFEWSNAYGQKYMVFFILKCFFYWINVKVEFNSEDGIFREMRISDGKKSVGQVI